MGSETSIEWTDATWNPVRGCARVSPGCENCYAERVAMRFSGPGMAYEGLATPRGWTRKVRLVEEHLEDPLRWRRPRRVFVNSMSDLFHEELRDEDIFRVLDVIGQAPRHTFQVLTKRAPRMHDTMHRYWQSTGQAPFPHLWLGVSVEDQRRADERVPLLLATPAAVRFLSCEPLLGPLDLQRWLTPRPAVYPGTGAYRPPGLDWVIIGGESGPGARPFDVASASNLVRRCKAAGVAVFVKQLGARPCLGGDVNEPWPITHRKGNAMHEWPDALRVREFPHD